MKLNKITFQWLIYHALHSDTAGHAELKIIEEIEKALSEDTLEIEGYERKDHFRDAAKMVDEWTKFDPNDPTTFPKEGTPVLFISYNPIDKWGMLAEIASDDVIDNWKNISRLFSSVFWREVKFPKPPVETEEEE